MEADRAVSLRQFPAQDRRRQDCLRGLQARDPDQAAPDAGAPSSPEPASISKVNRQTVKEKGCLKPVSDVELPVDGGDVVLQCAGGYEQRVHDVLAVGTTSYQSQDLSFSVTQHTSDLSH